MDIFIKRKRRRIKKIGLALGGGGARGFAEIGVIKAFEENGITFDFVAGTSVGSLIGAMYCFGKSSSDMIEFAKHLKESDIKKGMIPFVSIRKREGICISLCFSFHFPKTRWGCKKLASFFTSPHNHDLKYSTVYSAKLRFRCTHSCHGKKGSHFLV